MKHTPLEVANTFITRQGASSVGIEHMKLQKLVYFVHGWWLAYEDEPILSELPQVWKFGPVFPSLYAELKLFGARPIKEPVQSSPFEPAPVVTEGKDPELFKVIEWVWKRYGHLSAFALSDLTHQEGTAWSHVARAHNYRVPENFKLSIEEVKKEFDRRKSEFA